MKALRGLVAAVLLALAAPATGWAGWERPSVFPRPADPWKHWGRGPGAVVIVTPGFVHPHFKHGFHGIHPRFHRQPVWIPGQWVWTGFGWAWQPGHWVWW
ncbi:MAG TPA: hypothetical protein VNK50_13655 [Calidithermus sp.]|nr:hypothetical protein [Calidithermus sp.]